MDKDAISTSELVFMISDTLGKKVRLFKMPELFVKIGIILLPKFFYVYTAHLRWTTPKPSGSGIYTSVILPGGYKKTDESFKEK